MFEEEIVLGLSLLVFAVAVPVAIYNVKNWKSVFSENDTQLSEVGEWLYGLFFIANQLMAISKWFITEHYAFWTGLKELIWALIPLLNITYVWTWWSTAGQFMWNLTFG